MTRPKEMQALLERFARSFKGKKVLITGGAGFLGSWLCEVLVLAGSDVDCVDNMSTGKTENIKHLDGKMRVVVGDIEGVDLVDEYDCIFHLASRASPEEYQKYPIETLTANSLGTKKLLELRRRNTIFVYASSSEVYGDAKVVPTSEDYFGNVNPIGVRSCYDEGKRFGEALCMAYFRQRQARTRIARIFNSYGPRIREDGIYARALPRFISRALRGEPITIYGNGKQTRSFCYVTDTVSGLLRLALNPKTDGQAFNIGGTYEIEVLHLAKAIIKKTKSDSKIVFSPPLPDDPKRRCPDISKARRAIGWRPIIGFQEGLERTIDYFRGERASRL